MTDILSQIKNNLKGQSDAYVKDGSKTNILGCSTLCSTKSIGVISLLLFVSAFTRAIYFGVCLTEEFDAVIKSQSEVASVTEH